MIFKDFIKNKIKRYLDRFALYLKQKNKEEIQNTKQTLINELRSVGYGFKLNGDRIFFSNPKKVIIGNNVHIEDNFYAITEGGLIIGHNTHISRNLIICTQSHNFNGTVLPYDNTSIHKPVIIGDNVWIDMNVSILPGVTIGDGAVVGMGVTVNRDLRPLENIVAADAITLKSRDKAHYETLVMKKAFGGVNGIPLNVTELSSYFKTYKEQSNEPIVFVLGTGRSGTVSITDFLNKHPNCKAFHEHFQQIIRISNEYAYSNDASILNELVNIFNNHCWEAQEGQLLVHTDQRFWNLVPFLSAYFCSAKFIHLIREPYECIKSMVARDWYQNHEYPKYSDHDWAHYRLQGDKVGSVPSEVWLEMNRVEKCTWYYCYINSSISLSLENMSINRKIQFDLEQLNDKKADIQDFLGLDYFPLELNKKNSVSPKHKNHYSQINDNSDIDKIIKKALIRFQKVK